MHKIADNLTQVEKRIQAAAQAAGRNPAEITLLAVSKTQSAEVVSSAYAAGQRHFGENYLQEALDKMAQLKELEIIWHFIGPVQSNKTAAIARAFAWVHSVDRLKIAERLSAARGANQAPLNLCLQVNIDGEASKSGCAPQDAPALAAAIAQLPGLRLRGLMAIPSPANPRPAFAALRELLAQINTQLATPMDTLSMGMSGDLAEAIAEGATLVRIGTAIFGERPAL